MIYAHKYYKSLNDSLNKAYETMHCSIRNALERAQNYRILIHLKPYNVRERL